MVVSIGEPRRWVPAFAGTTAVRLRHPTYPVIPAKAGIQCDALGFSDRATYTRADQTWSCLPMNRGAGFQLSLERRQGVSGIEYCDALTQRIARELGKALDAELGHDVLAMCAYGLDTYVQAPGDLLRGIPFRV